MPAGDGWMEGLADEAAARLSRRFGRIYAQAWREMRGKFEKAMEDYGREREGRLKALDGTPEARKEFRAWCESRLANAQWLEAMADGLAARAADADGLAMAAVRDEAPRVYAENANMAAYSIERSIGAMTSFTLLDEDAVRLLAMESGALVPEVPYPKVKRAKDARWNRQRFRSAITQGILQGESVPGVARRVESVVGMDRRAATRAARTALTGAQNAGRVNAYRRMADEGCRIRQEWMAERDTLTRDSHRKLDGERVEVGGSWEAERGELRFPGDPRAHPAETWNCRCAVRPVVDVEGLAHPERASRFPPGLTYEEWKAGKNKAGQSVRGMAAASGIEWPKHGSVIRRAEYLTLRDEASRSGLKLVGFAKSDVDPAAARLAINAAAKALSFDKRIASAFPDGLTLELSGMFSGDFATTSKRSRTSILLNREAMRDVRALRKEYSNLASEGWFVAGTEADAIVFHEIGHSLAYASCIDPLKIASAITGKKDAELLEYVKTNLSKYAGSHENGIEIPSEAFSAFASGVSNEFAERFVGELLRRLR